MIVVAINSAKRLEDVVSTAAAFARALDSGVCLMTEDERVRRRERERVAVLSDRLRRTGLDVEDWFEGHSRVSLLDRVARADTRLVIVAVDRDTDASGGELVRIVHAASVPTLILRDPKSIVAWTNDRRKLRLLVCVDASVAGRATLGELRELHRVGRLDASVVHVVVPEDEHARLGLSSPIPQRGLAAAVERAVLAELRSWVEDAGFTKSAFSLEVVRATRDVASQLATFARRHQADLVVVGVTRAKGVATLFRPSALKAMIAGEGNVLCVPPESVVSDDQLPRFRSVLVPADLTPHGIAAVPYAYSLVASGGVVHLIHALIDPAEDKAQITKRLRALVPLSATAGRVHTEVHVRVGIDITHVLVSAAERLAVDAICMSTSPRSLVRKAFVPSIADELLRRCRRPVLMVPPQRHER